MADIQSAVVSIGRLLYEEARDLYKAYNKFYDNIYDKVKDLRDEVDLMQCFVRGTDASQLENTLARRWVAQTREFAYEAEDIVEDLLVRMDRHNRGPSDLWNHDKKYFYLVSEIRAYQRIGSNIDNLKDKISTLTSRLHSYGIIKLEMGEISSSWYSDLRDKTYTSGEEKIVGRDESVSTLVNEMVYGKTKVLAIWGDGGIGKTFLAHKIYTHTDIRRNFEAFAWAYVSQPCQISFIEQQLVTKLASKTSEQVAQMTDDELKDELHKTMCKSKCLVVLDGVWEKEVWDSLAEAFPVSNHDFKSKILITTRLEEVAKHVDHGVYITKLEPLNRNQSRELLEPKVGRLHISWKNETADTLIDEMLEYCGDLPLAIVVLGGVLSTKKTSKKWEAVCKNIKSNLLDQDEAVPWKTILEMCYYELPYQLKAAFIYLGHFPNNLEIPRKKITQLWEVEGLVSPGEDDPIPDNTLQDVAERCLAELVERSLVQVGSRGLSGKPKTCLLNDLIRDTCISKAYKSNWLKIVNFNAENPDPSPSAKNLSKMMKKGYRRLAIYCNESLEKLLHDYRHAKYTRSLLFFDTLKNMDVPIPLKKLFNNFTLIRVLDIENIIVKNLPDEVGLLIYLRYLSLKDSFVSKLPSTIRYLRCLQTLDLRVLAFVQLQIPDVLWEMGRLVHLYLPTKPFALRHKACKLQLKGLSKLETLVNFRNSCQEKDVCKLTNLRKFSSKDFLCPEDIIDLFASSSSPLHHLDSVSLRLDGQILISRPEILQGIEQLQKQWLKGQLPELHDRMLPVFLYKLSLCCSNLQNDPMPVLEKLLHLKKLSLEEDSYMGKNMSCTNRGFPELRYLTLKGLAKLEKWQVNQGAMPKLISLEINGCRGLKKLPEDLQNVKSLQELTLSYLSLSFYKNWVPDKVLHEWPDYCHVCHVPEIHILHVLYDETWEKINNLS